MSRQDSEWPAWSQRLSRLLVLQVTENSSIAKGAKDICFRLGLIQQLRAYQQRPGSLCPLIRLQKPLQEGQNCEASRWVAGARDGHAGAGGLTLRTPIWDWAPRWRGTGCPARPQGSREECVPQLNIWKGRGPCDRWTMGPAPCSHFLLVSTGHSTSLSLSFSTGEDIPLK